MTINPAVGRPPGEAARAPAPPEPLESFILVSAGGETFGLPVAQVVSVFRIDACTRVPTAHPHVAGILSHRGAMIAAVHLQARLGAPLAQRLGAPQAQRLGAPLAQTLAAQQANEIAAPLAVGVEHDGETVALIVDAVGDLVRFGAESLVALPEARGREAGPVARVYAGPSGLTPILDIAALFRFGTPAVPAQEAIC